MRWIIRYIAFFFLTLNSVFLYGGSPHLILIGPTGSGKGTFSQFFVKEYGYTQICPGDLFRDEIRGATELGIQIKSIVDRGDYVNNDITCSLVQKQVKRALVDGKPVIFDGFPRDKEAYENLDQFLHEEGMALNTYCIYFDITDEQSKQRILTRLVCANCKTVYNSETRRPIVYRICDECGCQLQRREADTEEVILKRLKYDRENIGPIVELIEKNYRVIKFNTGTSLDNCSQLYSQLFEQLEKR